MKLIKHSVLFVVVTLSALTQAMLILSHFHMHYTLINLYYLEYTHYTALSLFATRRDFVHHVLVRCCCYLPPYSHYHLAAGEPREHILAL
jgi:hypothetical protein